MPKSRQRKKKPVKIITNAEKRKLINMFHAKMDEYETVPLQQLDTLMKSGTVNGVALRALEQAIQMKIKITSAIKQQTNEQ